MSRFLLDEVARLQGLLGRYSIHVYNCEGASFTRTFGFEEDSDAITPEEGLEIEGYEEDFKHLENE
jgi:hypothetical protein